MLLGSIHLSLTLSHSHTDQPSLIKDAKRKSQEDNACHDDDGTVKSRAPAPLPCKDSFEIGL